MGQMMQPFGGLFGGPMLGNRSLMPPMSTGCGMGLLGARSSFSCQTVSFSSHTNGDGRVHRERFASSTVSHGRTGACERKEAYENTSTGIQRRAHERRIGEQGHRVEQERNEDAGEERKTETLHGIDEASAGAFHSRW